MSKFSENLRNNRKALKLSQNELANKLNLADTSISAYELEKNEPTIETLKSMSKLFHLSIDELVGNDFETNLTPETQELRYLATLLNKEYTIQAIFYIRSLLQYQKAKE